MVNKVKENSWRHVPQVACFFKARFKRLALRIGFGTFICALLGILVYLIQNVLAYTYVLQPLKKIYFRTNGVLNAEWLRQQYPVALNTDLMKIDILGYEKALKKCSQVHSAFVQRKFPDALEISIREYKPVAKLCVQVGDKKCFRFVSPEGKVFSALGYSKRRIDKLPLLTDVSLGLLKRQAIVGFKNIYALLKETRVRCPEIFGVIAHVSLKEFDPDPSMPWSQVRLTTTYANQFVFSGRQMSAQLERLQAILLAMTTEQRKHVASIDLSLSQPIVRFANKAF